MIVQCSWKVSDDRPVSDAVTWSGEPESADVEDEVLAENCLMLEAPDKGEGAYPTVPACQLLLSCQLPNQMSHVSVLCEARMMEVYGHHGEYLKTVRNELLEATDDMVVFRGDIDLEKPLTLCSIKFACLRSQSEMWLYGVKVTINTDESGLQNPMNVSLATVEQRLSDMGLSLSDKAEAFKQLVERCQKSPKFDQQDIGYIIATLQLSNLVKSKSSQALGELESVDSLHGAIEFTDNQNNLAKEMEQIVIKDENKESLNIIVQPCSTATISASSVIFQRQTTCTQTDEEYLSLEEQLKTYIDDRIEDLDKKIWEKVNRRIQETEAKILCKLDEIESFVKPQGITNS